jgi:predicted transcriptional regulator
MFSRPKAAYSVTYIRGTLGPLERQIMEILWRKKECSVRDVMVRLHDPKAYTTVMTTLSRLFTRGLATRIRIDRKFVYSARLDQVELDYMLAQRVLSYLLDIQVNSKAPELVSFYILKNLFQHDPKLFEAVVRVVKSRKSEHLTRLSGRKAANNRAANN